MSTNSVSPLLRQLHEVTKFIEFFNTQGILWLFIDSERQTVVTMPRLSSRRSEASDIEIDGIGQLAIFFNFSFNLGDFNLKYIILLQPASCQRQQLMNINQQINFQIHQPASNSYLPYIIQPSRHTSHSRTLIDNIFSNVISKDIISGNITATISDHLPQFLISPNTFADPPSNKSNVFERNWSNSDQENFVLD